MKADLHVHTDISDSSCSLQETIKLAKENGITHLGITNHDTVRGLREAMEEGMKEGIIIIPGVEISAFDFDRGKKVHILGYNFNLESENIKKLCDPLLKRRHNNSLKKIFELRSNGYRLDMEKISKRSKNSEIIYKQHIMAELVVSGYTEEKYSELYTEFFKNKGIYSKDIKYADVHQAVRAIKADGGIAVLAHPGQLDSYNLIESLLVDGLDGIEINHEAHTEEDIHRILEYCEKYSLITTGGSDFHGSYGSKLNIGEITCPEESIRYFENHANKLIKSNLLAVME